MDSRYLSRAAVILATVALVVTSVPARSQSLTHQAVAQQSFEEGVRLYESGQHDAALKAMWASYRARPSPNSRLYIARALRGLNRLAEAREQYNLAQREALDRAATDPRYQETVRAAQLEGEALEPRIGRLTVWVTPESDQMTLLVGDRELPRAAVGLPVPLDVGAHAVVVEMPGYLPARATVQIRAGRARTLRLDLVSDTEGSRAAVAPSTAPALHAQEPTPAIDPQESPLFSAIGWTALGVAAGGAMVFGIGATLAEVRYGDLRRACGEGPCSTESTPAIEEGRALQVVANSAAGVCGVAAAIGAVLLALPLIIPSPA